jgi:hypothetical protein
MDPKNPRNFVEFWPFYVSEHLDRRSRRLHFCGSSLSLICLAAAAFTENPIFLIVAILSGYAFAWVGHFFIEHNRPASFRFPLWSLRADFRMFALMLNRKMDAEIERLGLKSREKAE